MPAGDRTGPRGMGSRTGRGAGYCAGYGAPGFTNRVGGRGFGAGMGMGRGGWNRGFGGGGCGWRNMFYATGQPGWMRGGEYAPGIGYGPLYQQPDPELEKQTLQNQAQALQAELDAIQKRLAEVESAPATE